MYEVLIADSFCFPGCLPEGDGPTSNGDTFDTHGEALEEASRMLHATLKDAGWSAHDIAIADAELHANGEWACDMDYIIDDGSDDDGMVSPDGTRFLAFAVALVSGYEGREISIEREV
jgi:hypothetical protein